MVLACGAFFLSRPLIRFKNGIHTKDLHSLNRDLKRVIVIDWNPNTTEVRAVYTWKMRTLVL